MITTGARSRCSSPLWLAVIAKSKSRSSACSHGIASTSSSANTSATPSVTVEFGGVVNTSCTRRSASNKGTTSNSRLAEATVFTTNNTLRECRTVDNRSTGWWCATSPP
ncbi:hypothetical protein [Kutzneria sp. NPDC052558]|uniref:hypothetical protein n=1 Tax=Kutzneria sp. NPDC052558 TaxID=3364121 RepID=UPI0037CB79F3